jgi:hypothetical protein
MHMSVTKQSFSRTRRLETVALFAQVVYLMFSAVYVFKETVEHVLLSAGEGHHHHSGDEDVELLGSVCFVNCGDAS